VPHSAPDSLTPTHLSLPDPLGAEEDVVVVGIALDVDVTKVELDPGWH
jgi:hypothetical protein